MLFVSTVDILKYKYKPMNFEIYNLDLLRVSFFVFTFVNRKKIPWMREN